MARTEVQSIWRHIRQTPVPEYTPMQVARASLLVAEVAGFFCVGEIIARGQIIGYKH
jgi:hypothetical protein